MKSFLIFLFAYILTSDVKTEVAMEENLEESKHKMIREEAKAQHFVSKHFDSNLDPGSIIKKGGLFISPEEALLQANALPKPHKRSKPVAASLENPQDYQESQKPKSEPEKELKLRSESKMEKMHLKAKSNFVKKSESQEEQVKNDKNVESTKIEKKHKKKKSMNTGLLSSKENHQTETTHKRSKSNRFEQESQKSPKSKNNHKHRSHKSKKHSRKSKDGKKNGKKSKTYKK